MTEPVQPVRARVEPPAAARSVERAGKDPQDRRGGQSFRRRDEPSRDDGPDGEVDGTHVDVLA